MCIRLDPVCVYIVSQKSLPGIAEAVLRDALDMSSLRDVGRVDAALKDGSLVSGDVIAALLAGKLVHPPSAF